MYFSNNIYKQKLSHVILLIFRHHVLHRSINDFYFSFCLRLCCQSSKLHLTTSPSGIVTMSPYLNKQVLQWIFSFFFTSTFMTRIYVFVFWNLQVVTTVLFTLVCMHGVSSTRYLFKSLRLTSGPWKSTLHWHCCRGFYTSDCLQRFVVTIKLWWHWFYLCLNISTLLFQIWYTVLSAAGTFLHDVQSYHWGTAATKLDRTKHQFTVASSGMGTCFDDTSSFIYAS